MFLRTLPIIINCTNWEGRPLGNDDLCLLNANIFLTPHVYPVHEWLEL